MSSSKKICCFNRECKEAKSEERLRKAWRLRTGGFAELCDRCALVFEEDRFCDMFHLDDAGWRNCESCGKPLHCGCIVSVHTYVLLDAGGVDCVICAKKNDIMAPVQIWPPSSLLPVSLPERLKDLSVKNWNPIAGPSADGGQLRPPFFLWNTPATQSERQLKMPHESECAKLISGKHSSSSMLEKKKLEESTERVTFSNLNLVAMGKLACGNDTIAALDAFHKKEGNLDVLQDSCLCTGENDALDTKAGISEAALSTCVSGITSGAHPNASASISLQSSASKYSKDDTSGLTVPFSSSNKTVVPNSVSGTQSQEQTPAPSFIKQFYASPHNGEDTSGRINLSNGRSRGDVRGRNQLLPRYWPRLSDQELQRISRDSNSVVTPLFEKILSASDAGRIGRLVLPKKCAEAYFPAISQPEGLPLKVYDTKGNEWVFQFRFWPNNNSRMYVLEGVTPYIQSMQMHAGDTVTFSRMDPEGKLVMGFRKASTVPPSDQDTEALKTGNGLSKHAEVNSRKSKSNADSTSYLSINQVNSADSASIWSKEDKPGYIAKEMPGDKFSVLPSKRKSSIIRSKSKRLQIEYKDLIELKLTWEQAQGLLCPPPNHVPAVEIIEGHEFEEYEEAPVLGKPSIFSTNHVGERIQWVQCEDCSKWRKLPVNIILPSRWTCSDNSWDLKRSTCSSAQEVPTERLKCLLSSNKTANASKKRKAGGRNMDAIEASEGLETLANLAILGEGEALPPSQPTTRHPRHRPGCTCIVCIQPPSGKGPKHKDTCTCNVCLTVKRRFRTLMMRREKRQSEKEAESARKKQEILQPPEKPEHKLDVQLTSHTGNTDPNLHKMVVNETENKPPSSPFKPQIDLNIQPEREDEPSPVSDSGNTTPPLQDARDMHQTT